MKYRITDTELPGEELVLDIDLDEPGDGPEVDEDAVGQICDWWINETSTGGRGYETLEDGGYVVLVEVNRTGDSPTIGVWMQEDHDWLWPLSGFPFTSLEFEEVPE